MIAAATPSLAGTVYSGPQMARTAQCPSTTFRGADGKQYFRAEDCPREFSQFSSIAIPIDGNFNHGMRAHALRFRPLPDGHIQLY